jgi:hypothetical protein
VEVGMNAGYRVIAWNCVHRSPPLSLTMLQPAWLSIRSPSLCEWGTCEYLAEID